ncbi:hypothetical protein AKJ09_06482 [Labilithrix luteola]|uniref:Uncharacterized protein n=1 Tax=Labilithrix luteola TaxID=1391654 RepID=A0A0K1Q207_9BACT|nr:hypothetical protein AKJ09_06482 [Labilithrix luteola]
MAAGILTVTSILGGCDSETSSDGTARTDEPCVDGGTTPGNPAKPGEDAGEVPDAGTTGDASDGEAPPPRTFKALKVGFLPDTQANGDNVAIHPMKAILDKFQE